MKSRPAFLFDNLRYLTTVDWSHSRADVWERAVQSGFVFDKFVAPTCSGFFHLVYCFCIHIVHLMLTALVFSTLFLDCISS